MEICNGWPQWATVYTILCAASLVVLCLSGVCVRFVYPITLQSCLHKGCRLHIFLTRLHKTDPQTKDEQGLDCLTRVSYICHETKVCAPHLKLRRILVIMSVAHKCRLTFPFSFTLFFPGFSGHCTITRVCVFVCHVGGSGCGYITTIKVRNCVAMFATEYVHLVSSFTFCF